MKVTIFVEDPCQLAKGLLLSQATSCKNYPQLLTDFLIKSKKPVLVMFDEDSYQSSSMILLVMDGWSETKMIYAFILRSRLLHLGLLLTQTLTSPLSVTKQQRLLTIISPQTCPKVSQALSRQFPTQSSSETVSSCTSARVQAYFSKTTIIFSQPLLVFILFLTLSQSTRFPDPTSVKSFPSSSCCLSISTFWKNTRGRYPFALWLARHLYSCSYLDRKALRLSLSGSQMETLLPIPIFYRLNQLIELWTRTYNRLMNSWQRSVQKYNQHNSVNVRYDSGMTSQQKFNSITESVLGKMKDKGPQAKGCPMHPKPSNRCRKCQELLKQTEKVEQKQEQIELSEKFPEALKWGTAQFKSLINQKLQRNIEDTYFFKKTLRQIGSVRELVGSLTGDEISLDAFIGGTTDAPTDFMMHFYRLIELRPTRQQLSIMLKANNVNVRCMGLLFLRMFADSSIVYSCLCPSFKDHKLLNVITVGEYAMRLLDEEQMNHGGMRLPRIPVKIQKAINVKVAKVKEERDRVIQRERSRSRSREKDHDHKKRSHSSSSSSSSSSSQSSSSSDLQEEVKERRPMVEVKEEVKPYLSLRDKIRLLKEKEQADKRRQTLLDSYKAEKVERLDSEDEGFEQSDEVQKIKIG